ncbi:MAG: GNAT family N-acetyltransferase, partial [Lachnospiraceae bacterium]|nr:GNAT family N-acetyltransferase [Lachnospiraceae bacterium]
MSEKEILKKETLKKETLINVPREKILIRTATPEDAEALLDIYAPYVNKTAITFEYEVP